MILAEKDKEEMEEAIASFEIDMHGSTVLCRNGDPLMRAEQIKVSAQFARYGRGRRHRVVQKHSQKAVQGSPMHEKANDDLIS